MHRLGISVLAVALTLPLVAAGCYSTGDGTAPPGNTLYFPVGLAVSPGGSVLYAVNSDFDLQWNGGTLQSYDLTLIRQHALVTIANPNDPVLPQGRAGSLPSGGLGSCSATAPIYKTDGSGTRQALGESCSPPVDSTFYVRDSAIIGAFATDLQRSRCAPKACLTNRLFVPVRGDASLTWANIESDLGADGTPLAPPAEKSGAYAPFRIDCGPRVDNRCDAAHHAGTNPNEPGNTRNVTLPGEPFGMAQSEDGQTIAITHQNDTKTSLFATGMSATATEPPSLQFVLDGLPVGGNGIVAVPHDPAAFPDPAQRPRPAFLQTSRAATELDLIRYYSDSGDRDTSSLPRPFLLKEASFPLTVNAGGQDSRGIVIDSTPRIGCKLAVKPLGPGRAQADVDADNATCARLPARVFFANRSPASMLTGEIGEPSRSGDTTFDADRLLVFGNVPLSFGPSKLYLAPIVDAAGRYALRVFIVCFDAASIFIYDPDAGKVENIIRVGAGPFAMAFDPFDLADVAARIPVPQDSRVQAIAAGAAKPDLKKYRFAYIASFTNSFVQVLDLDNARVDAAGTPDKSTFEKVVFTLGVPTLPKGSH